jgi:hypothetical protein
MFARADRAIGPPLSLLFVKRAQKPLAPLAGAVHSSLLQSAARAIFPTLANAICSLGQIVRLGR